MLHFLRMAGVVLLGLLALACVAWGWAWWLAWAMHVGDVHGPTWRGVAIGGMALVNVVVAFGLFRLQDRYATRMDYRIGGRAPRDVLYCQRCGAPARVDQMACAACGGTRLGISRPRAAPEARG